MVNGTTRLIQNAAPSEAVVYAQALIGPFNRHPAAWFKLM